MCRARRCRAPHRRPRRTWSSSARATPGCAPRCRPRAAGATPWCSMPRMPAGAAARATAGRSRPASSRATTTLARRYGAERAFRIVKEGHNSLAWAASFVADGSHRLRLPHRRAVPRRAQPGPLRGAGAPATRRSPRGWRSRRTWSRAPSSGSELGTDAYFGGVVYRAACLGRSGAVPSGHAGPRAGGRCHGDPALRRDGDPARGRRIPRRTCAGGTIAARNVVVATNGYTGALTPWLRRRVIPIGSYIIATEPIAARDDGPADADGSYRQRHAQGGLLLSRLARRPAYPVRWPGVAQRNRPARQRPAPACRNGCGSFPNWRRVRISHSWMGFVAYTFDEMMRAGVQDGHPLRDGLLRIGCRHGGLSRHAHWPAGAGAEGRRHRIRRSAVFDPAVLLPAIPGSSRHRSCTTGGTTASDVDRHHLGGRDLPNNCAQASSVDETPIITVEIAAIVGSI